MTYFCILTVLMKDMQYVISACTKTSHSTGAIFCKYIIVHFNQKRSQNTPSKCISICVEPCYNTNYLHTYNVDANASGPFLDLVCNFNFEIQLVCKLLRKRSVVLNCYCSALHYTQVCFDKVLIQQYKHNLTARDLSQGQQQEI